MNFGDVSYIHKRAIASLSGTEEAQKVENIFVLPKENFEAVDFTSMGVVNEDATMLPKFIEGEKYALQGVSCDGFEMPSKTYELVGMVDNFHGVEVDYVIMKQLDGKKEQIFSFSKNDCALLGIEYQEGLQPFPRNMPWKRVKEKIEFNKDDLSTTPRSEVDNTVRWILLKLNGFKDYSDGYVLSPSGKLIKEELFEKSLRIINNEPIVYGNGYTIKDKTRLNAKLVFPKGMIFNHGNFISQNDEVYVLIKLKVKGDTKNSIDYGFGIEPKYLENIKPQDLFTIEWNELGCFTVEEYKEIKEKAKKKAIERAKRLEEERKKRIAEEEKRKKLKEEKKIAMLEEFKKWHSAIQNVPLFETENNVIEAIDDFTKNVDVYFKNLNSALDEMDDSISFSFFYKAPKFLV